MRNAPFQNAAVAAGPARRSGLALALAVSLVLCACTSAALAGPGDDQERRGGGHAERAMPQQAPRMQEAPRNEARMEQQMRQEQMRVYEEQRRAQMQAQQQAAQDGFRRNGRLTPDERRDLRRQIGEAGQDIYSNTPRR